MRHRWSGLLLTAFLTSLRLTGQDLIQNGDFNTGLSNWIVTGASWSPQDSLGSPTSGSASMSKSGPCGFGGGFCSGTLLAQCVQVTALKAYALTNYGRSYCSPAGGGTFCSGPSLKVTWFEGSSCSGQTTGAFTGGAGGTGWFAGRTTAVAPAATSSARIEIGLSASDPETPAGIRGDVDKISFVSTGEAVVPNVVAHSVGVGGVLWGTELRVTNLTAAARGLTVKDWIGTTGWQTSSVLVAPQSTVSLGGWSVFNPNSVIEDHPEPVFGAAVLDVDDGLVVQSGILAGPNPSIPQVGPGAGSRCPGWRGGYSYRLNLDGSCNSGSGPIADLVSGFFAPSNEVDILWLSTDDDRRTNLSFINPDQSGATMTVQLLSADGSSAQSVSVYVPARGISQLTDVFRNGGTSVKAANDARGASAARARVSSSTRFYALAYIISNDNNTVGIGLPRLANPQAQ